MAGQLARAVVSTARAVCLLATGSRGSRSSTTACKRSILRRLAGAGAAVTVFPHDATPTTSPRYDGVLLSNGPGDPEPLQSETAIVRELLGRVPVLGICLGHQLLALATGHETYKLPFGHRGANHPVLERASGRVLVTSQNHGFAVAPAEAREATHVSLYDGTVEGLDYPLSCAPARCSSTQRQARARTTRGRSSASGSRRWRCRGGPTSSRSA